ncbi:MAG: isoprenyl transferase [Deltaproteobacteria bacterium]|nr:MAG: isoprenyl transferase [Deltaproteobacteria bacterium]
MRKRKDKPQEGQDLLSRVDPGKLPGHIAIIMDGNGRWAKKKFLSRIKGHEKGIDAVRDVVEACREMGIRYLTLYAFSVENWRRPAAEVSALMRLLRTYLLKERDNLLKNKIQLQAIGDLDRLPANVRETLFQVIEDTKEGDKMTLILALSYGARWEIVKAALRIARDVKEGKLKEDEVNPEVFSSYLTTSPFPDPDLLIRTSGELRLSNFLLWQLAYTELYITPTLWPDFTREDLIQAIQDYQKRERRFGMTSDQISELHEKR